MLSQVAVSKVGLCCHRLQSVKWACAVIIMVVAFHSNSSVFSQLFHAHKTTGLSRFHLMLISVSDLQSGLVSQGMAKSYAITQWHIDHMHV